MNFQEAISTVSDAITVKRVYGEPYESDGVTVIPAAAIGGGGGGGGGEDAEKGGRGGGGGFGINALPVGAYVIAEGRVCWVPATDVPQIAIRILPIAAAIGLLLLRLRS